MRLPDSETSVPSVDRCPTCGSRVTTATADEGTSYFVPITNGDLTAERDRYRQTLYELHTAIEQYSLWEPGRAGHAAAHRRLMASAQGAGRVLDGTR